jgi:nucleoside 2-deoxyribosyltransferase
MLAFLCGGMEYAPEGGRQWRERMRLWIQQNLNHRVYDPTEEVHRILSPEEAENLGAWKTSDPERFRRVMRFIINHDLNVMAAQADYVVCYWDQAAARGGGTQAELTAAYRKGIPVYCVAESPANDINGWVLGCTDRVFASFDELEAYLAATYGKTARQRALWEEARF